LLLIIKKSFQSKEEASSESTTAETEGQTAEVAPPAFQDAETSI
jgi:hypothetical protein